MKSTGLLSVTLMWIFLVSHPLISNDLDQIYPKGNRVSVSLFGGMTLSQQGGVWSTIRGNFDVPVGYGPAFGGSLSYSLSQPLAIDFAVVVGRFEAEPNVANPFRNDYLQYTGRLVVYLSNIFQTWRFSDRINPYVYAGFGRINFELTEMATPDRSESEAMALAGAGMKFRITNLFDLFANYEFIISDTDFIDGRRAGHPRDMWGVVHFGITTNIGSLKRKHIRWHHRDQLIDQYLVTQSNRLAVLERARIDLERQYAEQREIYRQLENRLNELNAELKALEHKIDEFPTERVIRFETNILFELGSHRLTDMAKAVLDKLSETMRQHPEVRVRLIGHTDNIGPAEYNLELSRKRATAVASYLMEKGIAAERIRVEGRGQIEPAATNQTEEGRRLNRRVVIELE